MKFVIAGAGAIGAYIGAKMSRAGQDVALFARGPHLRAMQEHGVRVIGGEEDFTARPPVFGNLEEAGRADVLLLGVKAHGLPALAPQLHHVIGPETIVVSTQNGVPWWYFGEQKIERVDPGGVISAAIERQRVVGSIVYFSTEIAEPGVIRHVSGDRISIGEPDGTRSERCRKIAEALVASGLRGPITTHLREEIWVKILGNMAFNPISALTSATLVRMIRHPEVSQLVRSIMQEGVCVAARLGMKLPVTIEQRIAGAEKVGEHKTSMLQDWEAGRPLEAEPVVGAVLELGEKLGVEMPHTRSVYACVKLMVEARQGILKSRWVQLGGSVVAMLMIANLQYSWTLFVQPIRAATGWKLSDVQWAFTLYILFQTWVMPLEGWLIDRMGPRIFISIAGIICGIGWAAMGHASTLPELYICYAVAGMGAAFVYSGSMATGLKWFPDKRGLASGIIAAGYGSGSAMFIPVIAAIIRRADYQHAFLYTGIAQGAIIFLAAQVLRKPGAEVSQWKAAWKQPSPRVRRNTEHFTTWEMLRTPHFYALYGMMVMMATGGLLITAQAGPVARNWGISASFLTLALALNPVANGASRIFWGWLSDRLGRENTMSVAFTLHAACLVSVLWAGHLSGTLFTVTLVLTFFTWGEAFSLFPSTVGDYYGVRYVTSNYCFLYSGKGVASIIGGGLGALLFEWFGSWSAAFYGSAVMALLAGAMAMILKTVPLPAKKAPPVRSAMSVDPAVG